MDAESLNSFKLSLNESVKENPSLNEFCELLPAIPIDFQISEIDFSHSIPVESNRMNEKEDNTDEIEIKETLGETKPLSESHSISPSKSLSKAERRRHQIKLASRRCRRKQKQTFTQMRYRIQELEQQLEAYKKKTVSTTYISIDNSEEALNQDFIKEFEEMKIKIQRLELENKMIKEQLRLEKQKNGVMENTSNRQFEHVVSSQIKNSTLSSQSINMESNDSYSITSLTKEKCYEIAVDTYCSLKDDVNITSPGIKHIDVNGWKISYVQIESKNEFSCSKFIPHKEVHRYFNDVQIRFWTLFTDIELDTPGILKYRVLHRYSEDIVLAHRVEEALPGILIDRDLVTLSMRVRSSDYKVYIGSRSVEIDEIEVETGCVRAEERVGFTLEACTQGGKTGLKVEMAGIYDFKGFVPDSLEEALNNLGLLEILDYELEIHKVLPPVDKEGNIILSI